MGIRAKIAEAFVSFTADITGLRTGLKTAEKETAGTAGRISTALGTIGRIAFPAGVVASIVATGRAALNSADQISKMSTRTGVSTETLSVLKYAADLADVSIDGVANSFKFLANTQDAAKQGNKESTRAFRDLGISIRDLQTLNPEQLWLKTVEGLASIQDPALRSARAVDIFGRSGTELLTLVNDLGKGGLEKVTREAERLGIVLDTKTAFAAAEFNDNLERMQAGFRGATNSVMREVLPALNTLGDSLAKNAGETTKWINPLVLLSKAVKGVAALLLSYAESWSTAGEVIESVLGGIGRAARALVEKRFGDIVPELKRGTTDAANALRDGLTRIESGLGKIFDPAQPDSLPAGLEKTRDATSRLTDEQAKANDAAREGIIQLQLQRAELAGNAAEAERLRRELDLMTAAKMRESGVSEELIQRTIGLTRSNREYEASLKALSVINQVTVDQLREEKEWRDKSYATTQKALDLDLAMRKARAESIRDTQALAAIEREAAEIAAQRRAQDIAAMEISIEQKRRLITLSEQQLVTELAVIDAQYETGWKGTIQRTIAAHKEGAETIDEIAQQTSNNLQYALGDAFYSAVTGNIDKVDDAFKDFFKSLLREITNFLAKRAVLKLIETLLGMGSGGSAVGGQVGGWGFAAGGAVFKGGIDFPTFANGGIVDNPTVGLIGEGRFDEAVIPMPNGAVPVEMRAPKQQDTSVTLNQRIVLDASVLQAMKSSPDEMITVIGTDILRGGSVLNAIQSRVRK